MSSVVFVSYDQSIFTTQHHLYIRIYHKLVLFTYSSSPFMHNIYIQIVHFWIFHIILFQTYKHAIGCFHWYWHTCERVCVCNVYVCTMCKRVGEGAFFSSQSFSTYRLASYSDTMMMMMLIHMPYQWWCAVCWRSKHAVENQMQRAERKNERKKKEKERKRNDGKMGTTIQQ